MRKYNEKEKTWFTEEEGKLLAKNKFREFKIHSNNNISKALNKTSSIATLTKFGEEFHISVNQKNFNLQSKRLTLLGFSITNINISSVEDALEKIKNQKNIISGLFLKIGIKIVKSLLLLITMSLLTIFLPFIIILILFLDKGYSKLGSSIENIYKGTFRNFEPNSLYKDEIKKYRTLTFITFLLIIPIAIFIF
jgi:hypothetical protein